MAVRITCRPRSSRDRSRLMSTRGERIDESGHGPTGGYRPVGESFYVYDPGNQKKKPSSARVRPASDGIEPPAPVMPTRPTTAYQARS